MLSGDRYVASLACWAFPAVSPGNVDKRDMITHDDLRQTTDGPRFLDDSRQDSEISTNRRMEKLGTQISQTVLVQCQYLQANKHKLRETEISRIIKNYNSKKPYS